MTRPTEPRPTTEPRTERRDFLRDIIDADLAAGRHTRVATRFPPEPNGYLHIGHAKSICLNFGLALDYGGTCNLRYDDTNPTKEDVEYVQSIEADVRWLGFAPTAVLYSADYFGRMYDLAVKLVGDGKAYVCDLSEEEFRAYRGTLTEPGRESPYRERTVAENLDLFERMRGGEFADGSRVLRARIDMSSANMKMRDPPLYRIRHAHHHRTGDAWCLYPMYDYAHPLEDAIEGITHSICTLEFENNRELYDWVIEHTGVRPAPRQYEFARLNIDYTVMSKRKLLQLVEGGHVTGWDDPRMPTIAGMRRRGYRPEAIRAFCDLIGVARTNSVVDLGKLEFSVRDDLNKVAPRAMAVLRPLTVVVTNLSPGESVTRQAPFMPAELGDGGSRAVALTRTIAIEQDDFQETPEAGYLRLAPGRTVRLRHGPCVTCTEVVRDASGALSALHVTMHPETTAGQGPSDGRKVWSVLHWVSLEHAVPVEVRLYDRLFSVPRPDEGDFLQVLNRESLECVVGALVEPALAAAAPGSRWQFERLGYFSVDPVDSRPGGLVFNRIVSLRETVLAERRDVIAAPPSESNRESTRPARRTPAEYRAEARVRDPALADAYSRYLALSLPAEAADVLSGDRALVALFDAAATAGHPVACARWLVNELPRVTEGRPLEAFPVRGEALGALIALAESGAITGPAAKEVFAELVLRGGEATAIIAARGLDRALDTTTLEALVDEVLAANVAKVAEFRAGRTGLLGFFVGQVVRAAKGAASPTEVNALVSRKLGA